MSAILGRKIGMTSIFTEDGQFVPCTVIEAGPCPVTQVKTMESDGYEAVQIGFGALAERKLNKPKAGHLAKAGTAPVRHLKEFRQLFNKVAVGDVVTVDNFAEGDKIKVSATSKGRGFQGVVKRHHFGGVGMTTHGQSDRPRAPGSIGSSSFPSRVFKGMRMAGRMGGTRITVRNLTIVRVIPGSNLLMVKGSIPGAPNGVVEIVKL
ncbi:MAG: 50S ribosomal protein L3 ['Candidatus Kapabacteria' thiocyanatum]|uniref:Large ribosomal subunit protein uL3 n=1 Tax=Candidatus Kapaibacterium thiocyanatum TaxID=1895771 RepID=A0A1M3KW68_9BACT|nr:50S ribosomal protein L3 ['Candidatus Kapabacteria' thiocyanatum]OJX56686.1 MAG: 50S ribosomal protein L3 ['Candidatus Kapabacteria' thiocyanatum]